MAMVVQHNLTAMNSNRMLGVTNGAQAKSTEKLSSGYKINRAADDAAGLTISEKMRKQIRGLSRASTNAQDGVSAVQTAEGALTEVHSMLQRMNELAVQASNGTNSESDRKALQDEIEQLTTEIDRVAETTKFNEMYLLKGDEGTKEITLNAHDAGLKGTLATDGDTATFTAAALNDGDSVMIGGKNFKIGAVAANGVTAASEVEKALADAMENGKAGDTITVGGTKYTAAAAGDVEETDAETTLTKAINTKQGTNGDSITIEGSDGTKTVYTYSKVETEEALQQVLKDAIAAMPTTVNAADSIKIGDTEYKAVADIDKVKTVTDAKAAFNAKTNYVKDNWVEVDGTKWTWAYNVDGKAATAAKDDGTESFYTDGNGNYKRADALGAALGEGDSYILVAAGTDIYRVSGNINTTTGVGLYDKDGNKFKVPDTIADGTQVTIKVDGKDTESGTYIVGTRQDGEKEGFFDATGKMLKTADVESLVAPGTKITYAGTNLIAYVTAAKNEKTVKTLAWNDSATPVNSLTKAMISSLADGTKVSIGSTKKDYTVGKPGDTITKEEAYAKMKEELIKANSVGTTDAISVTDNKDGTFGIKLGKVQVAKTLDFNLHVGADADMTNKINVNIDTMNAAFLGIKGLDIMGKGNDNGVAATYAIDAISDAVAKVSAQRSALGAVQNRLEHTIANLDNIVENTTSAESRIRDTDMAKEMVEFSKNNILAQAGTSMLAQANQSNQSILSLLQ